MMRLYWARLEQVVSLLLAMLEVGILKNRLIAISDVVCKGGSS